MNFIKDCSNKLSLSKSCNLLVSQVCHYNVHFLAHQLLPCFMLQEPLQMFAC